MKGNSILIGLAVLSAILLAGLVYVLKTAISHPPEMANDYQMTYREVDKNYDKIVEGNKIFDSKYKAEVTSSDKMKLKENSVTIKIATLDGKPTMDANITALITRPDTTKLDQKLSTFKLTNGAFSSPAFDLPKEGRWQISIRVQINDAVKFVDFEGFAKASN